MRPETPQPPHDTDVERALIGAAILDPLSVPLMAPLSPAAFYHPSHGVIWSGILALAGQTWTVPGLRAHLGDRATPVVSAALRACEEGALSPGGLEELAVRLRELHLRRQVMALGVRLGALALDRDVRPPEILSAIDAGVLALTSERGESRVCTADALVMGSLAALDRAQTEGDRGGASLGVEALDRMTGGGMRPGELWLLAARPGIGKSALAGQALVANARAGRRCLLISLEMSRDEIGIRLICSEAEIDQRRAKRPAALADYEMDRIKSAAVALYRLPLHTEDGFAATVADVSAIARKIQMETSDLGLVVVDYLQLMGGRGTNREQEIAGISRGLKKLAKDLAIPVLALSQFSRDNEKAKRRPQLTDLRESGSLEQDASGVVALWRDPEATPEGPLDTYPQEAIILKQRNGPLGSLRLAFEAKITRFREMHNQGKTT